MKILVTGGAGFVGSHLCEALIASGHEVQVIDDLSTGRIENLSRVIKHPKFSIVVDNMLHRDTLSDLVQGCDLIYHLAAAVGVKLIVSQPVRTIETNIRGSELLLHVANKWRKPVVLASTSEIYGKNEHVPFKEDQDMVLGSTSRSRWSYACSKAIDEFLGFAYFKENGLPVTILRLFNTVGPRQIGQYGMVLPTFVKQALAGDDLTVFGDGLQSRTFCYVSDVTKVFQEIVDCEEAWGEAFNVGSSWEISILDLAKMVKERTSSNSKISFLSYDKAYEAGFEDMKRRVPDISKIKKYIGFEPSVKIEEIVDNVIEYYRSGAKDK